MNHPEASDSANPSLERLPISCFIIARDEADRIGRTIRLVRDWVGEVVVVDSGSSDDTVAIAESLGARVLFRAWDGYGPQKRFGEACCRFNWLLNLDADEVPTPELREEILTLFAGGEPPLPAWRLPIVEVYPGRDAPRPFSHAYRVVRLYDRRRARYSESLVHDRVDTADLPVGDLSGRTLHYSVRSLAHQRRKLGAYFALQLGEKSRPAWRLLARLPLEYPVAFLRYYIVRRHVTGGWFGLRLSHVHAVARTRRTLAFLRKARQARLSGQKQEEKEKPG
jgi:glycosyltransferase involved in cell wall biosynthesis